MDEEGGNCRKVLLANAQMLMPRFPNGHCLSFFGTNLDLQMVWKHRKNCETWLFHWKTLVLDSSDLNHKTAKIWCHENFLPQSRRSLKNRRHTFVRNLLALFMSKGWFQELVSLTQLPFWHLWNTNSVNIIHFYSKYKNSMNNTSTKNWFFKNSSTLILIYSIVFLCAWDSLIPE